MSVDTSLLDSLEDSLERYLIWYRGKGLSVGFVDLKGYFKDYNKPTPEEFVLFEMEHGSDVYSVLKNAKGIK